MSFKTTWKSEMGSLIEYLKIMNFNEENRKRKVEDGELSEVYNEKLDQQDILDADDELNRVYSRVV